MSDYIKHIGIEAPDDLLEAISRKSLNELKADGLNIVLRKRQELGVMNAMEWIIPTAIIAYVFKSYFDGFLKEAGKDHYNLLKSWLKNFANDGRLIKVRTVYSSKSINKKSQNNTQSKSVSLLIQTKSGKLIKLLFDEDLGKEDWDNAIDQLLDYAIENYENYPEDKLTLEIEKFNADLSPNIYAIINREDKKLLFYSDRDLAQIQYAKQEEAKRNN